MSGELDPQRLADEIEATLRAVGTVKRAEGEKAYLKSDLEFVGATVLQTRDAVRALLKHHPDMDGSAVIAIAEALWAPPIHERRVAAAELLSLRPEAATIGDLDMLERMIRESRTWALVDPLSIGVVGPIVEREPVGASTVLDRWAVDDDFWVRRASLLAELRLARSDDDAFTRFITRADRMLDETEFFIRKAIGWVLREAGKQRPDDVIAWLGPRTHRASGVTMREAVKYLPEADRDRLMAAYKAKVAAP